MSNQPTLQDGQEREKALDPQLSFIVQAPAGSGKTELLTQRYLLLLGYVKHPEEILAITFTKKSAAEMRMRVIKALTRAANEPEPEASHDKQTWQLAKQALHRNTELTWDLLDNPNRLQIQTIDSFNASLTRQLPLLSMFGAPLDIADDAAPLYRETVQEFLSHLEENVTWADSIEVLLTHMDNDLANVETLLINMLAKRDQWLPYVAINSHHPELRQALESHLTHIIIDHLTHLQSLFPLHLAQELTSLMQFAAEHLLREDADSDSPILHCQSLDKLPSNALEDKFCWLGIAKFLLTEEGTWRKSVNKKQGFPAPSDTKNAELKSLYIANKLRMKELLDALNEHESLRLALKELTLLPHHQYEESHWETLKALQQILPVIVAQLKLIFQEHGKIDYIENAQAALLALGTEENPTDITLALDYKIQHILIDEFQDTSNSQYRLLEKLMNGWQPYDGRTLFVVGDPMQSIYRFREAEVGLFIRARKKGIGHLDLEPLTLSVNFRSIASVVNWVNESFQKVMPPIENIGTGAVSYSPSIARKEQDALHQAVMLHPFINPEENAQAEAIVNLIQHTWQTNREDKIAILVRSRSHLKRILPALKAANLTFRALDIEPLATRPVIQDLLALTRALLHPADRIAWLAILRAPWCGLTLADLLIIAGDKTKGIIWEQLQSKTIFSELAEESQARVSRFILVLEAALAARRRHSLRYWVEHTWLELGGPACIDQASDLEDANAFFNLLEKLDKAGDLGDIKQLNNAINKLYAAPNNKADDSLQIMTIHNAKGLEFDVVILPHLERKASQDEKQLMQWMERVRANENAELILAPIQAVGEDNNAIYDYIKRQHNVRMENENSRLLYVAATRAKKQLHLFFNLKTKESQPTEIKEPANNSLLQKLWCAIQTTVKEQSFISSDLLLQPSNNKLINQTIKRLTPTWIHPLTMYSFMDESGFHNKQKGFALPENNRKKIGTVTHQILQMIAQLGIPWWTEKTAFQKDYIKSHFLQLGMLLPDALASTSIVEKAIANTLNDPRGLWILSPHTEAQAELPVTMQNKNLIIDRTFIDEKGIRWIIDYKSADYAGDTLDRFLDVEQKQYEPVLRDYYHAFKALGSHPIRIGLYFPLVPAWREWSFENEKNTLNIE
jgi:ATP-dependent exoDNAse (exonuclease V) beta subunit